MVRHLFRATALVLVLSFAAEQAGFAELGTLGFVKSVGLDPSTLRIPLDFVTVKEIHQGSSGKLIIHIQDAHANTSGQLNLAHALDSLMTDHKIPLVLVEGSSRDVTLDEAKKIIPKKTWERAAKRFLLDGILAGEEYLNLTSDHPMKLRGIEQESLYNQNLEAYARLAAKRQEILDYIALIQKSLGRVKNRLYPKALLQYESVIASEAKQSKGDSFEFLFSLAQKTGISLKTDYPHLFRLKTFFSRESKRSKVSQSYLKKLSQIDFSAVLQEQETLEESLYRALLPDQDKRLICALDKYLTLLQKAYSIRLTSEEFKTLEASAPDFQTQSWQAFLNQKLIDLNYFEDLVPYKPLFEEAVGGLKEFYSLVDQRDQAFMENASRIMTEENQNTAFLITGGYHTEHLTQLFKQQNISYIVLTPIIKQETNTQKYEKVLLAGQKTSKTQIMSRENADYLRPRSFPENFLTAYPDGSRVPIVTLEQANDLREMAHRSATGGLEGARLAGEKLIRDIQSGQLQVIPQYMISLNREKSISERIRAILPYVHLKPTETLYQDILQAIGQEDLDRINQTYAPHRQEAITFLTSVLQNDQIQRHLREGAAFSLGQIAQGNQKVIALLTSILQNDENDHHLRQDAAFYVGQIDPGNQPAITFSTSILQNNQNDFYLRRDATVCLGQIAQGNQEVIALLISILKNDQNDRHLREGAAFSLGQIAQGNQQAINSLISLIKNNRNNLDLRQAAARSLGQIAQGNQPAITFLTSFIENDQNNLNLRQAAAHSLGQIARGNQQATTFLISILQNDQNDRHLREGAAFSLGQIAQGNQSAITFLTSFIENDQNNLNLRQAAAHSLGQIDPGNQPAVTFLTSFIENDQNNLILRQKAARYLGDLSQMPFYALADTRTSQKILNLFEPRRVGARFAAAQYSRIIKLPLKQRFLGWLKWMEREQSVEELIKKLEHSNPNVRWQAVDDLYLMAPQTKNSIQALIKALENNNHDVSLRAKIALIKIGYPAVPFLIQKFRDKDRYSADAAMALGFIGPLSKEAIPDLLEASVDRYNPSYDAALEALAGIIPNIFSILDGPLDSDLVKGFSPTEKFYDFARKYSPQLVMELERGAGRLTPEQFQNDPYNLALLAKILTDVQRQWSDTQNNLSLGQYLKSQHLIVFAPLKEVASYFEPYLPFVGPYLGAPRTSSSFVDSEGYGVTKDFLKKILEAHPDMFDSFGVSGARLSQDESQLRQRLVSRDVSAVPEFVRVLSRKNKVDLKDGSRRAGVLASHVVSELAIKYNVKPKEAISDISQAMIERLGQDGWDRVASAHRKTAIDFLVSSIKNSENHIDFRQFSSKFLLRINPQDEVATDFLSGLAQYKNTTLPLEQMNDAEWTVWGNSMRILEEDHRDLNPGQSIPYLFDENFLIGVLQNKKYEVYIYPVAAWILADPNRVAFYTLVDRDVNEKVLDLFEIPKGARFAARQIEEFLHRIQNGELQLIPDYVRLLNKSAMSIHEIANSLRLVVQIKTPPSIREDILERVDKDDQGVLTALFDSEENNQAGGAPTPRDLIYFQNIVPMSPQAMNNFLSDPKNRRYIFPLSQPPLEPLDPAALVDREAIRSAISSFLKKSSLPVVSKQLLIGAPKIAFYALADLKTSGKVLDLFEPVGARFSTSGSGDDPFKPRLDLMQTQELDLEQQLELTKFMLQSDTELDTPIPQAVTGVEGLKIADQILKERGAMGIVVGSTAKSLWDKNKTNDDLKRHSDIDVVVLSNVLNGDNFKLKDRFEGGIDWWLPVKKRVTVSQGPFTWTDEILFYANSYHVFISADIGSDFSNHDSLKIKPGLYLPSKSFLMDLTENAVLSEVDIEVDKNALEKFRERLDRELTGISKEWRVYFGGLNRVFGRGKLKKYVDIIKAKPFGSQEIEFIHSTGHQNISNEFYKSILRNFNSGARLSQGKIDLSRMDRALGDLRGELPEKNTQSLFERFKVTQGFGKFAENATEVYQKLFLYEQGLDLLGKMARARLLGIFVLNVPGLAEKIAVPVAFAEEISVGGVGLGVTRRQLEDARRRFVPSEAPFVSTQEQKLLESLLSLFGSTDLTIPVKHVLYLDALLKNASPEERVVFLKTLAEIKEFLKARGKDYFLFADLDKYWPLLAEHGIGLVSDTSIPDNITTREIRDLGQIEKVEKGAGATFYQISKGANFLNIAATLLLDSFIARTDLESLNDKTIQDLETILKQLTGNSSLKLDRQGIKALKYFNLAHESFYRTTAIKTVKAVLQHFQDYLRMAKNIDWGA